MGISSYFWEKRYDVKQWKRSTAYWLFLLASITVSAVTTAASLQTPYRVTNSYADVILGANPEAVMVVVGANYQVVKRIDKNHDIPSNAWKIGGNIGINPAYGQFSFYGEWQPFIFLSLRMQYDYFSFLGQHGGLLSFSSANLPFGNDVLNERSGDEERAKGDRLMFRPSLRAKIGRMLLRNETMLARYHFSGKGPYYFEQEYDTLLTDGDILKANDFSVLYEFIPNRKNILLFTGPYYEWVHANSSGLTRRRLGISIFWSKSEGKYFVTQRIYSRIGFNLEDRNRDNTGFAIIGFGMDF